MWPCVRCQTFKGNSGHGRQVIVVTAAHAQLLCCPYMYLCVHVRWPEVGKVYQGSDNTAMIVVMHCRHCRIPIITVLKFTFVVMLCINSQSEQLATVVKLH